MILVKDLQSIPQLPWSDYSNREFEFVPPSTRDVLSRFSSPIRMFSNEGGALMVAGIYRPTLLSTPHFWALLTQHFSRIRGRDIRTLISFLDAIPGDVETMIEIGNKKADRMARLFKFEPTTGTAVMAGSQMQIYRRPTWHS